MKKTKLRTRKYLDVQWGTPKMPDDVRKAFFNCYDGVGNDIWVEYYIGDGDDLVDEWLIKNTDCVKGELIFLKHWW